MHKKKTTEEFVREAKLVHSGKFDYSVTEYKGSLEKLSVICPNHGIFLTLPGNHLKGRGCPECGRQSRAANKVTKLSEFIERANALHGKKYDYSHVHYVALTDKVKIFCSEHGEFTQSAAQHLQGRGCPLCGFAKRSAARNVGINGFISRAQAVHGSKYDYSLADYRSMHDKVWIICPEHGKFHQKAANHINGNGCPTCRNEGNQRRFSHDQEQFLSRLIILYGERLNYKEVQYKNSHTKVKLNCTEHGPFEQYPIHLLRGIACPTCGKLQAAEKLKMPSHEFVRRAKELHTNKYDYSKVSFKNLRENVEVICPKHGSFFQVAYIHLDGAGCPKCRSSRGEAAIISWLTAHQIQYVHQWSDHDCTINIYPAKFDFYLPQQRVIIEFDGEQHFKPVKFGGSISDDEAESRYESQKVVDFIKDDWAATNNFHMLRIRFDEDVFTRLDEALAPMLTRDS